MTLAAPIEGVFEAMADHGRYDRFRPIKASELLKEGDTDRNGVGAVRRLHSTGMRFDEEVTAYEWPRRLDYRIIDVSIPLEHDGGSISLEPAGEGTKVVWTSSFRITVPGLGAVIGVPFAVGLKRSFRQMLEDAAELANQSRTVASPG